ncbi:MAG: DUF1512 family protein [Candidatus Aenigmatarchaeota archaeon]
MLELLAQFFGTGDWWTRILWFGLIIAFFLFYPKLMIYQLVQKLQQKVKQFEQMSGDAREEMVDMMGEHSDLPQDKLRENFDRIVDMFTVPPEETDPSGVMKKIKQMYDIHDDRYRQFIGEVSDLEGGEKKSFAAATVHSTAVHQIAKVVRHMLELVKETKNLQIGMLLKMQMPFIEKQIKMLKESVSCFAKEEPVGDSIGPLCAASIIGDAEVKEIAEDQIYTEKEIEGRTVFIVKPDGPAAVLGEVYDAVEKITKENDIDKIIPIDAKGKLKGEERGSVVEGIGFAMGGRGKAERHWIEDIAVEQDITIESIGINQDPREDVVRPMKEEIYEAVPEVKEAVERAVKRSPEDSSILVVGVGISVGVGNDGDAVEEAEKVIKKNIEKMKEKRKKEKEEKSLGEKISDWLTPY